MAAAERWYFTKEQLANTPSRKCGTDADKELSYRQQSANFIQDMGQRLQVTQLCINTAIVYMHRFYMFHPFTKFHRNDISTCALFLAAKVEEQPRKLEHVIKVAHLCLHRDGPTLDTKTEAYMEQAHQLVINENIMLQTLGFDIGIDHPHTYVVKCCQLVLASKDLAQTSYFMATNSLHLTTMCLQYKPTAVACLCIHLACKWSNWKIPQSSEGKEWFWYVDKQVTHQVLEELTSEFLAILDKCPSRLKRKIMSGKESQPTDKKLKSDMGQSSANSGGGVMDAETDLETYLNSKDFLDSQRDCIEVMPIISQPSTSLNNNNSSSGSSSCKPSPNVLNQSLLKADPSETLATSSPNLPLSSPSKKRQETLSLAAYREKKEKRRSEMSAPPATGSKDTNSLGRSGDGESSSSSAKGSSVSQQSIQEGSGERQKGRGHPEGLRADEKASKVRGHHHHHHHHHHRVSGDVESSSRHGSSEALLPPPQGTGEEEDHKHKQSVTGAFKHEPMFPMDSVNEDLKRLESLSSMMASVESSQQLQQHEEGKRKTQRIKEEDPLPPLPNSLDAPPVVDQLTGKMQKQSRHSKSRTPLAQEQTRPSTAQPSPGSEARSRLSSHERKLHKKKSPVTDYPHNIKAEVPGPPLATTPPVSKKDRHKSEKRASVNQEGLKVKITFNKSDAKAADTNHVVPLPPAPLPQIPPHPAPANPAAQPNLRMKINRKYLENNGKVAAPPPPPPPPPPPAQPRDGSDLSLAATTVAAGSDSEAGKKKQEGLKLVISKDRLSQGSHNKKQDRESRKRERNSPKGHDPLRNSDGFQNKVGRLDHHSGHGGSRSQMTMPPPPLIRGPPQGHHYSASNGKSDSYMQSQPMMMQYAQPPYYPAPPHQQYFQYQGMPPGYPSQGLPQFLTNPLPPPPPPPPLDPPPRDRPPLPRDPPPPPPPLPPE